MSAILEQVERDALALDPADRVRLLEKLWDSLEPPITPELQKAWANEIDRRCMQIDNGEVELLPLDDVFDEVREALRQVRSK